MDWYDVEDMLLDGTKKEISALRCPDCGEKLSFSFSKHDGSSLGTLRVFCLSCRRIDILHKIQGTPNCVQYFGNEKTLG